MGCDIHAVLELKHGDKWVGVHAFPHIGEAVNVSMYPKEDAHGNVGPDVDVSKYHVFLNWRATERWYSFFSAIAGVRGDGPEPLGMPEDASELSLAYAKSWDGDAHSHSYMSAYDFALAHMLCSMSDEEIAEKVHERLTGNTKVVLEYADKLLGVSHYMNDERIQQYRVVFFFDN